MIILVVVFWSISGILYMGRILSTAPTKENALARTLTRTVGLERLRCNNNHNTKRISSIAKDIDTRLYTTPI